ncbi:Flp pilus assembly protein CpaB [Pelagivirga sediminicola]|uniref:Flp pilus assembly protein CpaB n=1 Tax=Pelagivirga sediminicola TaxID=2170575 RepID=A0A2T7G7I3_9RHOB|nr:Flp pilus assembly protein CpaB [Pelagivirga sediminicola]PVA10388.1 Flp pilus assembly protein CpaB [Pelagivirga sediminicola]
MRLVFGLVLLLGLGLAGFAVYMVQGRIQLYQSALEQERGMRAPAFETATVYVAERSLKYGERIKPEDVRLVQYPAASLPEGIFQTEEQMFPEGSGKLRRVVRAMEKNEAVLAVKVTAPGMDAGITTKLERGMRAFTIKVDSISGVSGFLRPGDRVDVYWTGNIGNGGLRTEGDSRGDVTKLIEAGVQLIAVDQSSNSDRTEASVAQTVTVAILPQQVAALAQAQSTGRLSLSLVGAQDDTVSGAIEIDQRQLLGLASAPEAAPVQRSEVCTIRTRRGGEVIETPIPCTN